MDETKKQQLFPYFAYLYSQQLNPEKYGQVNSIEEWTKLIQESPEDIEKITAAAGELGEEDWTSLEQQYAEAQEESVQFAKKGAKLKQLKQGAVKNANKEVNTAVSKPVITQAKKGMKNPKRCKCGCELVTVKEDGGKLTSKCACGCSTKKLKKHQTGGQVVKKSYITQPGQKPFERSSFIPNKGIITPTEFFSNLSTKPNSPQHYLPYSKKTDTFNGGVLPDVVAIAPRKTTIGSKTNPVKLPEVTVTAQDLKKKAISNPKVVEWQKKLKAEGFDVGKVDGIWGKDTEKAYQAYLTKQNKPAEQEPQRDTEMYRVQGEGWDRSANNARVPFTQPRADFNPSYNDYYKKQKDFGTSRPNLNIDSYNNQELDNLGKVDPELLNQLFNSQVLSKGLGYKSISSQIFKKGGQVTKAEGGAFIRPYGNTNLNKPQPKPLLPTDKLKIKEKGGKVVKGQKGLDTDETWEPSEVGTGNNSMNPKDWTPTKKEIAIKKAANPVGKGVLKLKGKPIKKNYAEIVPIKPKK